MTENGLVRTAVENGPILMPQTQKLSAIVSALFFANIAFAQTTPAAPAAPAAPAPAPTIPPPSTPALVGTLTGPANPTMVDAGPLGKIFVGGVLSGIALYQDKPTQGA